MKLLSKNIIITSFGLFYALTASAAPTLEQCVAARAQMRDRIERTVKGADLANKHFSNGKWRKESREWIEKREEKIRTELLASAGIKALIATPPAVLDPAKMDAINEELATRSRSGSIIVLNSNGSLEVDDPNSAEIVETEEFKVAESTSNNFGRIFLHNGRLVLFTHTATYGVANHKDILGMVGFPLAEKDSLVDLETGARVDSATYSYQEYDETIEVTRKDKPIVFGDIRKIRAMSYLGLNPKQIEQVVDGWVSSSRPECTSVLRNGSNATAPAQAEPQAKPSE
jgi:hypothetical protein